MSILPSTEEFATLLNALKVKQNHIQNDNSKSIPAYVTNGTKGREMNTVKRQENHKKVHNNFF